MRHGDFRALVVHFTIGPLRKTELADLSSFCLRALITSSFSMTSRSSLAWSFSPVAACLAFASALGGISDHFIIAKTLVDLVGISSKACSQGFQALVDLQAVFF